MKKYAALVICVLVLMGMLAPNVASAQKTEHKVVRVGWYESTYCYWDQYGRRRGIAYEYQQRIAAHTGWIYEYVEESWPNLLKMLIDGEIDLMSDVSYTQERTKHMLFPALPMGAESYYVYVGVDNTSITAEDLQSFNGKKVGVNKDSFQEGLLRSWAEKNELSLEVVELTDDEAYFMDMLADGRIDAIVSLDNFGAKKQVAPVCKIGASDFYFAVNKDRPDLLGELNSALSAIQDEDPYFSLRMNDEYVALLRTNAYITPVQENWLSNHGAIRVG